MKMKMYEFRGGPIDGERRRTAGQRWFQVCTSWPKQETIAWYRKRKRHYVHDPDGPRPEDAVETRPEYQAGGRGSGTMLYSATLPTWPSVFWTLKQWIGPIMLVLILAADVVLASALGSYASAAMVLLGAATIVGLIGWFVTREDRWDADRVLGLAFVVVVAIVLGGGIIGEGLKTLAP